MKAPKFDIVFDIPTWATMWFGGVILVLYVIGSINEANNGR